MTLVVRLKTAMRKALLGDVERQRRAHGAEPDQSDVRMASLPSPGILRLLSPGARGNLRWAARKASRGPLAGEGMREGAHGTSDRSERGADRHHGRRAAGARRRRHPDRGRGDPARSGAVEAATGRSIDARGCVVTPGLVNTHHHLYQTLTRAVPAGQDALLFGWLKTLYPIWARYEPEDIFVSAQLGLAELALSGCTMSSDHLYLFPNGSRLEDTIEAAGTVGHPLPPHAGGDERRRERGRAAAGQRGGGGAGDPERHGAGGGRVPRPRRRARWCGWGWRPARRSRSRPG